MHIRVYGADPDNRYLGTVNLEEGLGPTAFENMLHDLAQGIESDSGDILFPDTGEPIDFYLYAGTYFGWGSHSPADSVLLGSAHAGDAFDTFWPTYHSASIGPTREEVFGS